MLSCVNECYLSLPCFASLVLPRGPLPCLAHPPSRALLLPPHSMLMHQQRLLALCCSPPCSASFTSRLTAAAGSSSGPAGARRPSVTHPDLLEISTVTLALLHFCIGSQLQDYSALYSSELFSYHLEYSGWQFPQHTTTA